MISLSEVNSETTKGKIRLAGQFVVEMEMPAQGRGLPDLLEGSTVKVGPEFMREIFRLTMECADQELVLKERGGKEGKGIELMGHRPYTFKGRFGTVVVPRIRIKHKADNSTSIPSHRAWQTPKQICILAGLKEAICDLAVKESYYSTLRQIERETGEVGILSKSSICNIVHQTGAALQEAQQKRARLVYEQDGEAVAIMGRAESYIAEDFFDERYLPEQELTEENAEELFDEIDWDPRWRIAPEGKASEASNSPCSLTGSLSETVTESVINRETVNATTLNSAENKETIILQVDEVVVASQEKEEGKYLVTYNGVVNSLAHKYYFSAATSAQLYYQLGALLATLGVQQEGKKLVLISDCANWVTYWYEGAAIADKESVLCWWHLKKKCGRLIGEAIRKLLDRQAMKGHIVKLLWRGEVAGACEYLKGVITDWEDGISKVEIKAIDKLIKLKEYLEARQPYIPDYLARVKRKEWVASTQVEKLNDFSISQRCKKKNGMRWKRKGVGAIAALEVAKRNGELSEWREQKRLPQWRESEAIAA